MAEERYCRKGKHVAPVHEFAVFTVKQRRKSGKMKIYTYTRHICKPCKYRDDVDRRREKVNKLRVSLESVG